MTISSEVKNSYTEATSYVDAPSRQIVTLATADFLTFVARGTGGAPVDYRLSAGSAWVRTAVNAPTPLLAGDGPVQVMSEFAARLELTTHTYLATSDSAGRPVEANGGAELVDSVDGTSTELAPTQRAVNEGLGTKQTKQAPDTIEAAADLDSTHVNRQLKYDAVDAVLQIQLDEDGGTSGDDTFEIHTLEASAGVPTLRTPSGEELVGGPGFTIGATRLADGEWALGTTGLPVRVTGETAVGSVLTCRVAPGWTVTGYQWVRDNGGGYANISAATSSTYTRVNGDAGCRVTCRVTGLSFLPHGSVTDGAVAPAEIAFIHEHENFTTTFGSGAHAYTFDHAIPAGGDAIIMFMTNGIPTLSNPRDENGLAYSLAYASATVDSKKAYVYYRAKCATAPTQFIVDSDLGTALRMQCIETEGMASSSSVSGTPAGATLGNVAAATHGLTPADDGAFLVTHVNTPGSRTPVAINGSALHRLRTVSGNPFTGAISEHILSKECGLSSGGAAQTNESTWTGEGATSSACTAFSVAFKPGL